jgi:hypothetical protein
MQVDSDSDSAGPHSPDTSFREDEDEDDLHPSAPSTFSASVEPIPTNPDDQLFATMSSYDDLKYIIRCLRKETKLFGKESWTVSPQLSWTNVRRSAFLCWTTRTLGFTLRAIGNSATYLSISKAKGQELKERLESALLAYKQKEIWTARQPEAVPFPIHTDTIARPSSVASLVLDPPPYADWRDPDTDALAHGLQSLSVRATSTAVHMTRTVTLEPVPDHAPVWSRDLQLLGHTSPTKGGKLSLASVRSSYSAYSVTMNAGTECLETYVPSICNALCVCMKVLSKEGDWLDRPLVFACFCFSTIFRFWCLQSAQHARPGMGIVSRARTRLGNLVGV